MAFNTLEYLEQGNVDFVFEQTISDHKSLIMNVRNSERKREIVKGFLNKLLDTYPSFCLPIIYDMDEYYNETIYLLRTYFKIESFSKEEIENFLNNSSATSNYLLSNLSELLDNYKDDLDFIFKFLLSNKEKYNEQLKIVAYSKDLHLRYSFMKYLLLNNPEMINYFYEDISKYLTSINYQENEQLPIIPDLMTIEDASELAFLLFDNNYDYETYLRMKNFILNNYPYNYLASYLIDLKMVPQGDNTYIIVDNDEGIAEFLSDSDTYFQTAGRGKLKIYKDYSSSISSELIEQYKKYISYFCQERERTLSDIDYYGLSKKLETYLEKYLDLSSDKTHEFIEDGSTASCYRIGDYVFKLCSTKWSYEDIICPDLYLIIKNLEEVFVRDKRGVVVAGIEVQKYLKRDAKNIPPRTLSLFTKELNRLGYYYTDSLMNGPCGDNCRLLDDYHDSGENNPPEWFKKTPLVLVDRDRVYRKDNIYPKQLRSYY